MVKAIAILVSHSNVTEFVTEFSKFVLWSNSYFSFTGINGCTIFKSLKPISTTYKLCQFVQYTTTQFLSHGIIMRVAYNITYKENKTVSGT